MLYFHPDCKRRFDSLLRLNKKFGDYSSVEKNAAINHNLQGCCGHCGKKTHIIPAEAATLAGWGA